MKTLYKTLPEDKSPKGHKYRLNKWYKEENFLGCCNKGFHGSQNIINAMRYVTPGYVALCEVRGDSDIEDDKEAWSEIRIIKWKKWTKKDSVALSIFAAELVLENYENQYPDDLRPREAIEAVKRELKSNTVKNWSAAESAARSAARSAESAVLKKCHNFVVKRKGI